MFELTAQALATAERIHVTGNAGAGKSTLAAFLGSQLGLPVVHLDQLVWRPGWVKVPEKEKAIALDRAVAEQTWIIDGVSTSARSNADIIVFLDPPVRVALWRGIRRAARLRFRSRPELGTGYPELRALHHVIRLSLRFNGRLRAPILADLEQAPAGVHLRTSSQVDAFMQLVAGVGATDAPHSNPSD